MKRIPVKVIARQGRAALVEFRSGDTYPAAAGGMGGAARVTVPADVVGGGTVAETHLLAGVPYGDDFASLVGDGLQAELYRQGVWTWDDVLPNLDAVKAAAIRVLAQPVVARLIGRARDEK